MSEVTPGGFVTEATIHQRMVAILAELPAIGKAQRNQQQNFMYRGHDDVLNALNPLLAKYGVFVVPNVIERETGTRQTKSGSVMYEVNLHVQYRFYGPGGDFVEASSWGEGTDSGDKSTNKAMTMAFKNVLAQSFAVSTEELSDPDAQTPEETVRPFDPETGLLEGALSGRSAPKKLAERLAFLSPTVDWAALLEEVVEQKYGEPSWRELNAEALPDFWRRLANAEKWISEAAGPGDFPPVQDDVIVAGIAYAFSGIEVHVSTKQPEPPVEPEEEA